MTAPCSVYVLRPQEALEALAQAFVTMPSTVSATEILTVCVALAGEVHGREFEMLALSLLWDHRDRYLFGADQRSLVQVIEILSSGAPAPATDQTTDTEAEQAGMEAVA